MKGQSDSPSWIDNIDAYIKLKNNRIIDLKFCGIGCDIYSSSTDNIMTIILKNKATKKAKEIIAIYNKMILGKKFNKTPLKELLFNEMYITTKSYEVFSNLYSSHRKYAKKIWKK